MICMQHWKFLFAFFCSEKQLNLFEQFHGSLFRKRKRKIHIYQDIGKSMWYFKQIERDRTSLASAIFWSVVEIFVQTFSVFSVCDFPYMYTYKCHETRNDFPRNLIEYVLLLRTFTNCIYIGSRIPANKEPVDFQNCAKLCANCFCCKSVHAKGFCLLI